MLSLSIKILGGSKMANVKKPIYKKWWFILIIVILLISIFSKNSGESNQSSEEEKQATKTETKQVINLNRNASLTPT